MELFEKSSSGKRSLEPNPNDFDSSSSQKSSIEVPEELRKSILDFSVAFLKDKPKNVVDYAVDYFTRLQSARTKKSRTSAPYTVDTNRLTIDNGRCSFIRSAVQKRASERYPSCSYLSEQKCPIWKQRRSTTKKSVSLTGSIHEIFTYRSIGSYSEVEELKRESKDTARIYFESRSSDTAQRDSAQKGSTDSGRKNSKDSARKLSDASTCHYWYRVEPLARRKTVFAESFNPQEAEEFEESGSIVLRKSPELRFRLKRSLKNVLIFATLDLKQMNEILDAMIGRRVNAGEVVVVQGTPANELFVIDNGTFEVYKNDLLVYTFHEQGVFGELALISTNLRLATVVAKTDGLLWFLDRQKFRRILLTKAYQKRSIYEQQLKNVPVLQVLTERERMKLADSMLDQTYRQGDIIFKEGDDVNGMYLVVEGVVIIKATDKNGEERTVKKIGERETFFGELALLNKHTKRLASAYAATRIVRLAFLSIESFERVVGDSLEVVRRYIGISHSHYADLTELYKSKNIGVKLF